MAQTPGERPAKPVVLLVENDDLMREFLRMSLRPLGVETLEASNLKQARNQLTADLSLVVLDFYLEPEVGTDLLNDLPPELPVLLLTASIETRELLRRYPRISAALRKPIEHTEFRSAVQSLLIGTNTHAQS